MIKKTLAIALACVGFAMAAPASAHGSDRHDHDRHGWHGRDRGHQHFRTYGPPSRVYVRPGVWVRGERLPRVYRERHYVVSDWSARRLHRPQPGYQWVQVGSQYMMIAIASGVIAQIILAQ